VASPAYAVYVIPGERFAVVSDVAGYGDEGVAGCARIANATLRDEFEQAIPFTLVEIVLVLLCASANSPDLRTGRFPALRPKTGCRGNEHQSNRAKDDWPRHHTIQSPQMDGWFNHPFRR